MVDNPQGSPAAAPNAGPDLVRVKLQPDDLTSEAIKTAIYAQARYLYEHGSTISLLLLSRDVYEILNRRFVFKTAAHRDLPQFITPFGNLRVQPMDESLDEALSFIIQP
jgi:hypothetical protein